MDKLIMYLLESSVALAFFYLLYFLVLRRETFFSLNRFFLMGILVFSLLFPLLSFDFNPANVAVIEQPIEKISKFRMSYYDAMASWEFDSQSTDPMNRTSGSYISSSSLDWKNVLFSTLMGIYAIGIVVCLSRTFWTVRWIYKMITIYPNEEMDGARVIKVPNPISPFSFLQYVFVHDAMVNTPEFDQILIHEKTHIRQKHSIDLIFVQLLAAFLWFNPLIWQLIKSLKTTHEYIADEKMINQGYSLVEYQTLLLRQLISNNLYGLVHNFNLSFIKKRITMMKIQKSGWAGKLKVALVLSIAVIFSLVIVQCNSKMDGEISKEMELLSFPNPDLTEFSTYVNLKIKDGTITIDNELCVVDEIPDILKRKKYSKDAVVRMEADTDTSMGFVWLVQEKLREANMKKISYIVSSADYKEGIE